jgi:hypothetical protein
LSQYLRRRSNVMLDDGLVSNREVRIGGETYDVRAVGSRGTILLPVKTRETMGGGHALLFTRDIFKAISVAKENGYTARFSVIDPHRMMQTCALTDGFVRTGIIALIYGQVSVNATRCRCLLVSLRSHGRAIWTPSLESTTSGFKPTPTR